MDYFRYQELDTSFKKKLIYNQWIFTFISIIVTAFVTIYLFFVETKTICYASDQYDY